MESRQSQNGIRIVDPNKSSFHLCLTSSLVARAWLYDNNLTYPCMVPPVRTGRHLERCVVDSVKQEVEVEVEGTGFHMHSYYSISHNWCLNYMAHSGAPSKITPKTPPKTVPSAVLWVTWKQQNTSKQPSYTPHHPSQCCCATHVLLGLYIPRH